MLSCLDTWIGQSDDSTSDSGVYINDLPGLELKRFVNLLNEDDTTIDLIWAKIKANALRRFYTDVNAGLAKRYRIKTVSKSIDLGRVIDTSQTTASGTNYQGIVYELNQSGALYTPSNLKMISVQSVKIYLSSAVNTTVKVFDLDTMEQLYTSSVTGVQGWNTVNVNTQFDAYRVFICYDATTVTAVKLDVSGLSECYNCQGVLKGASSTIADPYTVTKGGNSFGLSVVLSENCSFNKLICNNKVNFTSSLLYCLGIAFIDEVMGSSSLNRTTLSDREQLKELKNDFMLKYTGGETGTDRLMMSVPSELKQAIEGINLMEDDSCLECNSLVSSTYAIV